MNHKDKDAIINALKEKNVVLPCPRCESSNFQVIGQTAISINENPTVISLGESAVPAALIVCTQCGFITMHALGSLGLIPKEIHG